MGIILIKRYNANNLFLKFKNPFIAAAPDK